MTRLPESRPAPYTLTLFPHVEEPIGDDEESVSVARHRALQDHVRRVESMVTDWITDMEIIRDEADFERSRCAALAADLVRAMADEMGDGGDRLLVCDVAGRLERQLSGVDRHTNDYYSLTNQLRAAREQIESLETQLADAKRGRDRR